jgi:hypothetical protein
MKRQQFLRAFLAAGALITIPVAAAAKSFRLFRAKAGFLVSSGKDRLNKEITLLEGDTFYTKVSAKDTDGDIYMFESERIKEGGPSHHLHLNRTSGGMCWKVNS